jgi:biopolymer transport protein ExbD
MRNKVKLDLDLTPLLDVIFIVLMVVMCQMSINSESEREKTVEAKNAAEEAQAKYEVATTQLENYENEDQLVAFITLNAMYEKNDPKTRHIRLAYNDETLIEDIVITPETQEQAYGQFVEEITSFVQSKEGSPVLLSIDDSRILYRDYRRLEQEIKSLRATYNNLFLIRQE